MNTRNQNIKLLQDLASGIKTLSSLLPQRIPIFICTKDGRNFTTTSSESVTMELLAISKTPFNLCHNGGAKFANTESEIDGTPWDTSKQYYAIKQS